MEEAVLGLAAAAVLFFVVDSFRISRLASRRHERSELQADALRADSARQAAELAQLQLQVEESIDSETEHAEAVAQRLTDLERRAGRLLSRVEEGAAGYPNGDGEGQPMAVDQALRGAAADDPSEAELAEPVAVTLGINVPHGQTLAPPPHSPVTILGGDDVVGEYLRPLPVTLRGGPLGERALYHIVADTVAAAARVIVAAGRDVSPASESLESVWQEAELEVERFRPIWDDSPNETRHFLSMREVQYPTTAHHRKDALGAAKRTAATRRAR